jgi:FlaA1/EpsC-like NDP-sugar epimerase
VVDRAKRVTDALRGFLIGLPRPAKSAIAFTADLIGFALCVLCAFWLLALGSRAVSHGTIIVFTALLSVALAWLQGMYRSVVRYMGIDLLIAGARTAVVSAVVGGLVMQVFVFGGIPRRWAVAYALFSFIYICGSRYFARMFLVDRRARHNRENVIIYGGGSAGHRLAMTLNGGDDFLPVAMIDDDPTLQGKKVQGLEVYPPAKIETLCDQYGATRILLAMPRVRGRARREILEQLSAFPLHVQTIPDLGDIVSGKARVDDLTDVNVEDLLGRDPVPPIPELLEACITGKSVMVTGAGGSIGAELSRQILQLGPSNLILFDISETALYEIDRQLKEIARETKSACTIVPLLGSVHHGHRVREVMESFSVKTVYHAAAYKHVPMQGKLRVGTVDSWVVWQLTRG